MQLAGGPLPQFLEAKIDQAVALDFDLAPISDKDFENEQYSNLKYSLEFSGVQIMYERKVVSRQAPVIPRVQYLFGFPPIEGLCIFSKNKIHKEALCNGKLAEVHRQSTSFVHYLQYLLVEQDEFNVWSYLPLDPDFMDQEELSLKMRTTLFSGISDQN